MNSLANTTLEVLASNPALRNAMIQLQEDNARLRAERDAARAEVERLRGELAVAQKSIPFDFVVGAGQLVQERDAARAAAARWRNRARFWRGEAWGWACEVFDDTQPPGSTERQWMAQFLEVTRRARRWQREGERHD